MNNELIKLDIETLTAAVNSGYSAVRLIAKLQPAGGGSERKD